jgi:hypothetical protein
MPDEKLTPADPSDIADSIAFALQFSGRKRVHDSDKYMAAIVAECGIWGGPDSLS